MSDEAAPVVLLGAGLAGLSASVELRRAGIPHRLLDRAARPGGLATTEGEAGYRFDRTGHLLHLSDPSIAELVFSVLDRDRFRSVARDSVVYSHGVVTKYPFQAHVHGLPPEVAFACVRDFVTATFDPAPRPVVTFEDFCLRHFGEAISAAFMIPYNTKLMGVHPREISAAWCDRFVPKPALDDVLRGAFGVETRALGYNTTFFVPRLGMGELVEALAERAAPPELSVDVQAIETATRTITVDGARAHYHSLVSSIPLPRLVELCTDAPEAVRSAARRLRATRLHYLDVALNTPCEKPWHWVYVPEPRLPFYRVGCYSNFSPAMAPVGKACLYVELASREEPRLADILPEVARGLIELGMIRAPEAIRFARLRHIDPAYVLYDPARAPALETIMPWLASAGIASIGRYGAWEYSAMEDAIRAGLRAAKATLGLFRVRG